MKATWMLPATSDRSFRHQLVFELAGAGALAAATGRWDLVGVAGAVLLPAVRSTWVHWIRSGLGLVPVALAALIAAPHGIGAIVAVWAAGSAVGILRARARHARRQAEDRPAPKPRALSDRAPNG